MVSGMGMTEGKNRIRRFWRDCGAAEIAEAAFVLPLLFVFILGIFQFARVYTVYATMQRAAQEGAHAAASSNCATCGTLPITADQVAAVMRPIFNTAHIDYTTIVAPASPRPLNSCTSPGTAVACESLAAGTQPGICLRRNVILNASTGLGGPPTSGTPVCGTSLSFVYPYGFSLPSVSTTPPFISRQAFALNLNAQVQVKGEN